MLGIIVLRKMRVDMALTSMEGAFAARVLEGPPENVTMKVARETQQVQLDYGVYEDSLDVGSSLMAIPLPPGMKSVTSHRHSCTEWDGV